MARTIYKYDGMEFSSLKSFCDTYDILPNILYMWSHRHGGVDAETGLTEFMEEYKSNGYTDHNNIEYRRLKDMAAAWGIPYTTLKERLSIGWETKKALTTPVNPSKKKITYRGKSYSSVRSLCFDLGIQQVDVYSYKAYHKCELEQAIDYYVDKKQKRDEALEKIEAQVLNQD